MPEDLFLSQGDNLKKNTAMKGYLKKMLVYPVICQLASNNVHGYKCSIQNLVLSVLVSFVKFQFTSAYASV
jgi:hypothetical protein